MKKTSSIYIIAILISLGLALVIIHNGMRFTGFLFLGAAALWAAGLLLRRWGEKSRGVLWLWRIFLTGTGLTLVLLVSIEAAVVFRGEADNSAVPVDAVIVLGAGVNGETPSAALRSRINAAAAYLETHSGVPVVLSGGQGPGEAAAGWTVCAGCWRTAPPARRRTSDSPRRFCGNRAWTRTRR